MISYNRPKGSRNCFSGFGLKAPAIVGAFFISVSPAPLLLDCPIYIMLNRLFCASVQIMPVEHIFLSKRLTLSLNGYIIKP